MMPCQCHYCSIHDNMVKVVHNNASFTEGMVRTYNQFIKLFI